MTNTPPPKIGLALGSGAARGWAHIGVLQGLDELGVRPDIIAGCSAGALVGGAHLIGALDEVQRWARELSPLSAIQHFSLAVRRGGFVDATAAFDAFRSFDRAIEDLETTFAVVASDLATGEEVVITNGSVIDAVQASCAIPVVFQATARNGQWLVDGALANPTPVSLARKLGADKVISVDLTAIPKVLERFDGPRGLPAVIAEPEPAPPGFSGAVQKLVDDTRIAVRRQLDLAKAKADAAPQLVETALAAADIFQMHLARAKAAQDPPDILIKPDMRDALPNAFDRADEFIEEGRLALLAQKEAILALVEK